MAENHSPRLTMASTGLRGDGKVQGKHRFSQNGGSSLGKRLRSFFVLVLFTILGSTALLVWLLPEKDKEYAWSRIGGEKLGEVVGFTRNSEPVQNQTVNETEAGDEIFPEETKEALPRTPEVSEPIEVPEPSEWAYVSERYFELFFQGFGKRNVITWNEPVVINHSTDISTMLFREETIPPEEEIDQLENGGGEEHAFPDP